MDRATWITLLEILISVATTLIGILFVWLKNSITRLDEKMEKRFVRVDDKIERSASENLRDIRQLRDQLQGVLGMLAKRSRNTEKSD